jgi:hypothetical protein
MARIIKRWSRAHMDAVMALIVGLCIGYILGTHL